MTKKEINKEIINIKRNFISDHLGLSEVNLSNDYINRKFRQYLGSDNKNEQELVHNINIEIESIYTDNSEMNNEGFYGNN